MNKFVIDTHIFLWLIFSPEKQDGKFVQYQKMGLKTL